MDEEKKVNIDKEIMEINETIKSIAKSLEQMAGSIDKSDGVFCIKGDIDATCHSDY